MIAFFLWANLDHPNYFSYNNWHITGEAIFMERFLKKRRTSVEDQDVGPSQEHNDAPPMNQTMPRIRHHHTEKMIPQHKKKIILMM